jgi:hypothetical protein
MPKSPPCPDASDAFAEKGLTHKVHRQARWQCTSGVHKCSTNVGVAWTEDPPILPIKMSLFMRSGIPDLCIPGAHARHSFRTLHRWCICYVVPFLTANTGESRRIHLTLGSNRGTKTIDGFPLSTYKRNRNFYKGTFPQTPIRLGGRALTCSNDKESLRNCHAAKSRSSDGICSMRSADLPAAVNRNDAKTRHWYRNCDMPTNWQCGNCVALTFRTQKEHALV